MLFVMDVGNTNTVLGLFDGDTLLGNWRIVTTNYRTGDELRIFLHMLLQSEGFDPKAVDGCCISSVVPQINRGLLEACRDGFGVQPVVVGPGIKTGLVLQIDNPKEVGADRIVNAVGALEEYEGALIIIDFGTATNFDVVSAKAEWRGGIIAPGIQLSANALFSNTAKLPNVEIVKPPTVIGRDTVTNIQSALTYGYTDMVNGLIKRIMEEMEDKPTVLATGGLAQIIMEVGAHIDHVDPELTLKGLKAIYRKNERKR